MKGYVLIFPVTDVSFQTLLVWRIPVLHFLLAMMYCGGDAAVRHLNCTIAFGMWLLALLLPRLMSLFFFSCAWKVYRELLEPPVP